MPDTIWVRKKELTNDGFYLILRVRSNIHQITVEDMDGESHTEYEYDEGELRYQVSDDITTSAEIKSLLETEKANLIQKAGRVKVQTALYAEQIENIRETIKKL